LKKNQTKLERSDCITTAWFRRVSLISKLYSIFLLLTLLCSVARILFQPWMVDSEQSSFCVGQVPDSTFLHSTTKEVVPDRYQIRCAEDKEKWNLNHKTNQIPQDDLELRMKMGRCLVRSKKANAIYIDQSRYQ